MTTTPHILAFAGSLRRDSWNKKLVQVAVRGAQAAGAEVTLIDLREFALPLYDGDLEKSDGLPPNAKRLRELLMKHQALLIASPEYNSALSGVLKNTIDWATRTEKGEGSIECFQGKVAGIMAASPGALGGLRGLVGLRSILGNIGVIVVSEQVAVSKVHEAFTPDGNLKDEKQRASVEKIGARVTQVAGALLRHT